MRSSWVCWWLLLAWALLLEQPVSGEEEGFQAVSSEGSVDPVETGQPESPLEPEDPENPPEQENLEEPNLEPVLTSEEELEHQASYYRDRIELHKQAGWTSVSHYKRMALRYMEMNDYDEDYEDEDEGPKPRFMHLEDSTITMQKAIGNLLKFRMFLKKGNCADERMNHDDYVDYILARHHHRPTWSRPCQKLDCVFTVFQDARTGREAVINSECLPLLLLEEMDRHGSQFPPPLDDDYADYKSKEDSLTSSDDSPVGSDSSLPASDDDTLD